MAHFTRRGFFGAEQHVELLLDGEDLVTRTWKAGEPPRERRTKLPWPGVRRRELLELVDRHATWQRVDPLPAVTPSLGEPAKLQAPLTRDELQVAMDELIERGDPWAALLGLAGARDGDERRLSALEVELERLCTQRFLPDAARVLEALGARVEWTQGVPDTVVLGDWEAPLARRPNAQQALAELGRSTLAARAQRWLVGVNTDEFPASSDEHLEALLSLRPPCVRHVSLGHSDHQLSWTGLHDPAPLAVFEHLTSVRLRGGPGQLEQLALPRLTAFTLETGSLSAATLATIAAAPWPRLERLEVWFGSYNSEVTATHVEAFLKRLEAPALRHLGLRACTMAHEVVPLLARWPQLRALSSVDLSMGGLQRDDVEALRDAWPAFNHLARFDLSDNQLGPVENTSRTPHPLTCVPQLAERLRAACPTVVLDPQRSEDDSDGQRYASIGE